MNRIHTISVPYAVMKACPLSWVQRVHIHKGKLHCSLSSSNVIQKNLMYNKPLLFPRSSCSFGEVPGFTLGHDGSSGPERHQSGFITNADCC